MDREHILLLGGTGISGVAFLNHCLILSAPSRPYLTLYVRSAAKLPSSVKTSPPPAKIRTVIGELDSPSHFANALAEFDDFPPVTTVISLLGAYVTLSPIFTRFFYAQPTPIADAFESNIMPQLKKHRVKRLLSLSTSTAIKSDLERRTMPWRPYLFSFIPLIFAPQGNEEMKGIAKHTIEGAGTELEWTVFRVPFLTDAPDKGVYAGDLTAEYPWIGTLSRQSQAKWLLTEIEDRKWVGKMPMLNDAS